LVVQDEVDYLLDWFVRLTCIGSVVEEECCHRTKHWVQRQIAFGTTVSEIVPYPANLDLGEHSNEESADVGPVWAFQQGIQAVVARIADALRRCILEDEQCGEVLT